MKNVLKGSLLLIGFMAAILGAQAQSCNLDHPVKAGELTLFPDINDNKVYYYVSDKPKLATGANGRPQFSFLRYVDNAPSGSNPPATSEGGIVHAVVSLSVTPEQLREAQRSLQRTRPDAVIQGPLMYKSGTFGIVSSFKDPQNGLTRQVLGLGNAPILDGQKAAISIHLTKQGAKILMESFRTPTPDISFTFEMDVAGYRSPKKAVIEANFDQIYEHKSFAAGFASRYLSAEIRTTFDDLMRSGAIKLTQVGEDEKMEALITTAYNKIADMMFSPLNGSGAPGIGDLTGGSQGGSLLDRATTTLRNNREEARATNRQNEERRRAEEERRRNNAAASNGTSGNTPAPTPASGTGTNEPGTATSETSAGASGTQPASMRPARSYGQTIPVGVASSAAADQPSGGSPANEDESVPEFSLIVTYEMKRIRQQGIFKIDLNKSIADNVTMRFDENIGDLTAYLDDPSVFREANLDDPLYVQREIVAMIDGMNAQDFGQYINSVNVHLVKDHESGAITNQELRIDRNNFNSEANNFKMIYGWKGDNNRRNWMDYKYEAEWSFFGGQTVKVPLQKTTSGVINLAPPYQRRIVEFQADAAPLADAGVRSVVVKLFYQLAGKEQMKQVVLNPAKGQLSEKIEFMLPADQFDYEYEVIWKLGNNETRSSGKVKSSDAIQTVDHVKA